jgi:glycerol uptake facilitator-like aquaporin
MSFACKWVAELIGTAMLLAVAVGSGIMGETLAQGNAAIALLANALATGAGLFALIYTFGPISGAHFNPVVSIVVAYRGQLMQRELLAYIAAQILGAALGVMMAHAMFDVNLVTFSTHARTGLAQYWSEVVATFGLIAVIWSGSRHHPTRTPAMVAAYIVSAYWFTASTSFANPAVTLARALTDSFAGIRPIDVPGFILAQLLGAIAATLLMRRLVPDATGKPET